jgi:quinol monooxygenase YgiN
MILITLKIPIRPDRREDWLDGIKRYTAAVRQEPGNISFDCFESIDTPNQFSVIEAFESKEAGDAHVNTDDFKEFIDWFPSVLAGAPQIINTEVEGSWNEMSELAGK